ncbi:Ig-like domain-containing protein [Methanosphaera sp. BMS]|uniref:Ig-like domain-containing protein n=1 Tax=Methanosphaera sp. BMS TaxID=1789762 RepID=UPI000DC1CB1B|nr:Ig-like domain-containing protein [Methanosphaera sp. BMS]AWX32818.1 hypothetical protein AW729_06780 [Methanosphaera sp. BMS]
MEENNIIEKSSDTQINVEKDTQIITTNKEVKNSPKTIVLNSGNFKEYVTDNKFNDNVSNGDTIDIDGKLDSYKFNLTIDKAVNLISSKNNSYINLYSSSNPGEHNGALKIIKEGSGTNITGLYFYNTHIRLENTTNVQIDNITFINENQSIGYGVGAVSVRDGSENITITNSYFKTSFNGGHSNVVFAVAYNCLFENNTIEGYGNSIGNLLYLTTYNVDETITPYTNINITIRNNNIRTINTSKDTAICVGMVLEGRGHVIENNIINRTGTAVMSQYSDPDYGTVTEVDEITFINNTIYGGTSSLGFPGIVANNSFDSLVGLSKVECSNNIFTNVRIDHDVNFHDNIANILQIVGNNSTIDNNTVFTDKEYAITITGENNTISNNSIGSLNGKGVNAINNSTIYTNINNDKPAIFVLTSENKDTYLDQVLNPRGMLIGYSFKDNLFNENDMIIFNVTLSDIKNNKISDINNYYDNLTLTLLNSSNLAFNVTSLRVINCIYVGNTKNIETYNSIVNGGNVTYYENSYITHENIGIKPNQLILAGKNIQTLINEQITEETEVIMISHNQILNVTIPVNITGIYKRLESLGVSTFARNVSFNEGSEYTNVTNCSFVDNGRIHPSVNINTNDITFKDCLFNATVKINASNINIINCTFYQELTINDTSSINIINCTFNTQNTPITIYNSARITIENNTINTTSPNTIIFDEDSDKTTNSVKNNQLITTSYLGNDNVIAPTKVKVEDNIPLYPIEIQVEYPEKMFKDELVTINVSVNNLINDTPVNSGFIEAYFDGIYLTNNTLTSGMTSFSFSYTENNETIPLRIWYYDANNKYEENNTKLNINFVKTNVTIEVEDFTAKLNEYATITATFKDERNNPLQEGNATFTISNLKYKTEIINGIATITEKVTEEWLDKNTFTITVTETDYNLQTQTKFPLNTQKGDVIINKTALTNNETITLNLSIKNVLDENINEGTITITDENNNPLNQTNVENGIVSIKFQLPENSNRNININYDNAEYYSTTTKELYIPQQTQLTITATEKVLVNKTTPITITLTDENNQPIANQEITVTINDENQTVNTNENGEYNYIFSSNQTGDTTITAKYDETEQYFESEDSITIKVIEIKLIIDPINSQAEETINITARILANDETYTSINSGKVTFKVNGKTLKDTNGKVIYAKVVGGVATIENYIVPADWTKNGTTIEAIYTGSTQYDKLTSEKTEITVTPKELTLTTENVTTTSGNTTTLTATFNDNTINTGKVIFKVNGKTLKDTNGKVIYAKVVNGQVTVNYTIPESMKVGNYTITAVYTSPNSEKVTSEATMTVVKA